MKFRCNGLARIVAGLALVASVMAGVAAAQQADESRFVVFAKAGRVNYVAGAVTRQRNDVELRESVMLRDNLEAGEVVRTGTYGRVEVLLNPGTYLRAEAGSEFSLLSTDLSDLRVRLTKGSLLLEAMGADDFTANIAVETPQTTVRLDKRGVYRVTTDAATTLVAVQKGRALVGTGNLTVKGGNQVTVGNGLTQMAKFDKKRLDAFDNWSRERSATLASYNQRITDDALRAALAGSSFDRASGRGHGLWFYDLFLGAYTFLPFSSSSWGSPYGWSYWNGINYGGFMNYCGCSYVGNPGNGNNGNNGLPPGGRIGQVIIAPGRTAGDAPDQSPGPPVKNPDALSGRSLLVNREPADVGFGRDDSFGNTPDFGRRTTNPDTSSSGNKASSAPVAAPVPSGRVETDSAVGTSGKKP